MPPQNGRVGAVSRAGEGRKPSPRRTSWKEAPLHCAARPPRPFPPLYYPADVFVSAGGNGGRAETNGRAHTRMAPRPANPACAPPRTHPDGETEAGEACALRIGVSKVGWGGRGARGRGCPMPWSCAVAPPAPARVQQRWVSAAPPPSVGFLLGQAANTYQLGSDSWASQRVIALGPLPGREEAGRGGSGGDAESGLTPLRGARGGVGGTYKDKKPQG